MIYSIITLAFIIFFLLELYRSDPMSAGVFVYKKRWERSEVNWAYLAGFIVIYSYLWWFLLVVIGKNAIRKTEIW